MSVSDTSKTSDSPMEPHTHQTENEPPNNHAENTAGDTQSTIATDEKAEYIDTNTSNTSSNPSTVDVIENQLDSLVTRFAQISTQSNTALSTIETITSSATNAVSSIHDISLRVNHLLSLLGTIKTGINPNHSAQDSLNTPVPSKYTQPSISHGYSSHSVTSNHSKNDSDPNLYNRTYLSSLSKDQLTDIILGHSHRHSNHIKWNDITLKNSNSESASKAEENHIKNQQKRAHSYHSHPHEKTVTHIKAQERNYTDYDKIQKQRVAIKALKQQRKEHRREHKKTSNSASLFRHAHAKTVKNIKAQERMGTNYEKIEIERARIKALKLQKKLEKSQEGNSMKRRRAKAHQKMLGLFGHAHETKYNLFGTSLSAHKKGKKHRPTQLVLRRRASTVHCGKGNRGKVRVLRDDEVLRFSEEIPIENFMKALNSGFVKIMNEEEINEQYFNVIQSAKSITESDICDFEFVVSEYCHGDDSSDSDWDEWSDNDNINDNDKDEEEIEAEESEAEEYGEEELLRKELLLLNLKTLKKRCKENRMSMHGGKLELIQKIINYENEQKELGIIYDKDMFFNANDSEV